MERAGLRKIPAIRPMGPAGGRRRTATIAYRVGYPIGTHLVLSGHYNAARGQLTGFTKEGLIYTMKEDGNSSPVLSAGQCRAAGRCRAIGPYAHLNCDQAPWPLRRPQHRITFNRRPYGCSSPRKFVL